MGKLAAVFFVTFKVHVAAAHALTTEAHMLAREQHLGLDDIDTDVLLERLSIAGRRLAEMMRAIHDDPDDASHIAEIGKRYRPRVRIRGADDYLARVVRAAAKRADYAHRVAKGMRRDASFTRALWVTKAHLDVAARVLDGPAPSDDWIIRESLAEHRQIVRDRRRGPGEVAV